MRKLFFATIILSGCWFSANSQDVFADTAAVPITEVGQGLDPLKPGPGNEFFPDTSLYLHPVSISPDTIKAWKNDSRFKYINNLDSLLKAKQNEEMDAYRKENINEVSLLQKVLSSGIMQGLFWLIAIALISFIVYRLFLSEGVFLKKSVKGAVNVVENPDKILSIADYDSLIRQSCRLGDYRLAVRYLFLKTLVFLTEKELIQHSPDKTNFQYVQEIREQSKTEFASLVLKYEYTWYGNFPLEKNTYSEIEHDFISFADKI